MRSLFWLALVVVALGANLWAVGCSGGGPGGGPRLSPLGDRTVSVGERLSLVVTVVAGSGAGPYTFFVNDDRPASAEWSQVSDSAAVFSWTPTVADAGEPGGEGVGYGLTFWVEDSQGRRDSAEVLVVVNNPRGPVFVNAPGYVLDLSAASYFEFPLVVKDDEAARVEISMLDGPAGSYLERTGSKSAYFFWRPTDEQIDEKRLWLLRVRASGFSGSDSEVSGGLLYEVEHEVPLIIRGEFQSGCRGLPYQLHDYVQDDVAYENVDAGQIGVGARVTGAPAESVGLTLFWSREFSGPFVEVAMVSGAPGGRFEGVVESAGTVAGEMIHYYYELTRKAPLPAGPCDTMRVPAKGTLLFSIRPEGLVEGCFDPPTQSMDVGEGAMWYGGRSCPGRPDVLEIPCSDGYATVQCLAAEGGGVGLTLTAGAESVEASCPGVETVACGGEDGVVVTIASDRAQGETWSLELLVGHPACEEDALEPNETPQTAVALLPGVNLGLTLCPGEVDYYRLDPPANSAVDIRIWPMDQGKELTMELLTEDDLTPLAYSSGTAKEGGARLIRGTAGYHGGVLLRVAGAGTDASAYVLDVAWYPEEHYCNDDYLAPNGRSQDAAALVPGVWGGLVLCPQSEDWFRLKLNGWEVVELMLWGTLGGALLDPDGELVCNVAGGAGEWTRCAVGKAGPHLLWVENLDPWAVDYAMGVAVAWPDEECRWDAAEPDGWSGDATSVGPDPVAVTHATLCTPEEDWYLLNGASGSDVKVTGSFDVGCAECTLELWDDRKLLALAQRTGDKASLSYRHEDRPLYVRVASGISSGAYSLLVWWE